MAETLRLKDWGPLPAERKLATEMGTGQTVVIGDGTLPPEDPPEDRVIRTGFLRALILGRIKGHTPHEKGVRVRGAYLRGDNPDGEETHGLDLEGCDLPGDLGLFACRIPDHLLLRSASLRNLFLNASHLGAGLGADGLRATGGVFLRGLVAKGEVRLLGAKLGGDLSCNGARLTAGEAGRALNADGLEATGAVFLKGLEAKGEVQLLGAKLGGDLDCAGARLTAGETGMALKADGLEATGTVFLSGLEATGEVRLPGAKLGGNLDCNGARLTAGETGDSLFLQGARVTGVLFLRAGAAVSGVLDLTEAEIGTITDDPACWPKAGDLVLNRCRYGAFVGKSPVDARSRIRWLSLQDAARFGQEFWPQPWEECARVLRAMGHEADARAVLIEKEKRQRKARRDRLRGRGDRLRAGWFAAWDWFMGATTRYGREPLWALAWLAGVWLYGAAVFHDAHRADALKPNLPQIQRAQEWVLCGEAVGEAVLTARSADPLAGRRAPGESRIACFHRQPEGQAHPRFDAAVYSLDTLLPVVSLEMQSYWIPDDGTGFGKGARYYLWGHIAAGWFFTLLAVAGLSGLIRTDNTT